MAKTNRAPIKPQPTARQLIEVQRRQAQKRSNMIRAGIVFVAVLAVVGIIVGVAVSGGGNKKPTVAASTASQDLIGKVTGVPAATLDTVGKGAVDTPPKSISGAPALTDGGKPVVFYMGGEFCPFCAAQRWALIVALSRFGTFSNLTAITSSEDSIPTFTFVGSTYTSNYLKFEPVEVQDQNHQQLQALTPAQQQLVNQFDPADGGGGNPFPFVLFGNQATMVGASFSPTILEGMTQQQVADQLSDPNNAVAKAINGTANAFTTQICKLTNNQPSAVCSSAAATAYSGG